MNFNIFLILFGLIISINMLGQTNLERPTPLSFEDYICDETPTTITFSKDIQLFDDETRVFDAATDGVYDSNGDFTFIGYVERADTTYFYIGKMNAEGTIQFIRWYENVENFSPWLTLNDKIIEAKDPISNNHAGYFLVSTITPNLNGWKKILVRRVDTNGILMWSKIIDKELLDMGDHANAVIQDRGGNFLIVGYREGAYTIEKSLVIKMDYDGNVKNCFTYDIWNASSASRASSIIELANGVSERKYIIAGQVRPHDNDGSPRIYYQYLDECIDDVSDAYTYNIDSSPYLLEEVVEVNETSNGDLIIIGSIVENILFRLQTTNDSPATWLDYYEISNGPEIGYDVITDEADNIFILGQFSVGNDGTGNQPGPLLGFVTKLNALGEPIWAKKYSGDNNERASLLGGAIGDDGGLYLTGYGQAIGGSNAGGVGFLKYWDTTILKTDPEGNLSNCDCHEPLEIEKISIQPNMMIPIAGYHQEEVPSIYNEVLSLNELEYLVDTCDLFFPYHPVLEKCDSLAVQLNKNSERDSCCWTVEINNQIEGCFAGLEFTGLNDITIWQPGVTTTSPDWTILNYNPNSFTIVPTGSGADAPGLNYIPTGHQPSIVQFCVTDYNSVPQQIVVTPKTWDGNFPVVYEEECADTLETYCAPPSEFNCIELVNDTVFCVGETVRYQFQVKNSENNFFSVDSMLIAHNSTVIFSPEAIGFNPVLAPGEISPLFYVDLENANLRDTICHIIIAKNGNDCCSDSIEYCIPIPVCEPCNFVSVDAVPMDVEGCCWEIQLNNDLEGGCFTGVQTEILTPGVYFSSINNYPGSGWTHQELPPYENQDIHWDKIPPTEGDNYISLGITSLPSICLAGIEHPDQIPQLIEVRWIKEDGFACRDTLVLDCNITDDDDCVQLFYDSIYCAPNGNYFYDFQIKNVSGRTFHEFNLNQFTPASINILGPSVFYETIPNGSLSSLYTVEIDATSVSAGTSVCYYLTLHEHLEGDDIHLNCCTSDFAYCFEVPDCQIPLENSQPNSLSSNNQFNDFSLETAARHSATFDAIIRPSVVTDLTTIEFSKPLEETANVEVLDIQGKIRMELSVAAGTLQQLIPTDILESGHYIVRIQAGKEILMKRLVKIE